MTPADQSRRALEICALAPVVPVLVLDRIADAAPLARALVAGGFRRSRSRCGRRRRSTRSGRWPRCRAALSARARC